MGWYVRRSMKIAPGVRVNFSNRGLGVSVGTRGVHVSSSATGRQTFSAGIPGTGVRYRTSLNPRPRRRAADSAAEPAQQVSAPAPEVTNLPPAVTTTSMWRVLWWVVTVWLAIVSVGETIAPSPGQSPWRGAFGLAVAALIAQQLVRTRHLHRIPREG